MSWSDALCLLGTPERTNDYGLGAQQLIYKGGKLIVYISAETSKVADIQTFE